MNRFLYKLIPPRPTFASDLSDAEAVVMGDHAAYWKGLVCPMLDAAARCRA